MTLSENKRRMLAGELYDPFDPALVAEHVAGQAILARYNASPADDPAARAAMLAELLGAVGEGVTVRPPFQCDYGGNIRIGAGSFVNFGAVFLDCAAITIGAEAFLAPNVQLYAATHPIDPGPRRAGEEYAFPITIGDGAWIGGGTIVCPGVTIGANSVIGAGSVVTRDVPAAVVAAGNPCRVIRAIVPGEPMRRPFAPPPPPG